MTPLVSRVKWNKTYRLINSCYPPCDVWEDIISNSDDWEAAFEIEAMSNPRVRQEIGDITLVPKDRVVTGVNSWWVMSAFTHINDNGSRFTNNTYGAYYAANNFMGALKEKAFGFTKEFMKATNEDVIDVTCRTLVGKIDNDLHDIRDTGKWKDCYLPDDYTYSQDFAQKLRAKNSNGIVFKSVRDDKSECFVAFWPDVVKIPVQERHVILHWDGEKISSYLELREAEEQRIAL